MSQARSNLIIWSAATISFCLGMAAIYSAYKYDQQISCEKKVEEKDENVISPDDLVALAESARLQGNLHYKNGCLYEAIQMYTEAIKLYPSTCADARYAYANRAACYLKKVFF